MKKSKFNETKILAILKEADAGMSGSEIRRMLQLEEKNIKLKQMYADLSLENNVLKGLIGKTSNARITTLSPSDGVRSKKQTALILCL